MQVTASLTITRGLPASGKTTYARALVAADVNTVRVNRDDLRQNLFGADRLAYEQEQIVTTAQRASVRALLESGRSVVVDDTHLRLRFARAWADLAQELGVEFKVVDLDTSPDECVKRDEGRFYGGDRYVGEAVIRDLAKRFRDRPEVLPTKPKDSAVPDWYIPDTSKPAAWIVDIDGTLAHSPHRSPYDLSKVHLDQLDHPVSEVARALHAAGNLLVVLSGREDSSYDETLQWLEENLAVPFVGPIMRKAGDGRKDYIVKAELFDEHVRDHYNVIGALDDRQQVVDMWRQMGLKCLQVQPGDF